MYTYAHVSVYKHTLFIDFCQLNLALPLLTSTLQGMALFSMSPKFCCFLFPDDLN